MAFLGLLVVPYAFKGPHRGAVALAVPLIWVLLGTAGDEARVARRWSGASTRWWASSTRSGRGRLIVRLLGWQQQAVPLSARTG